MYLQFVLSHPMVVGVRLLKTDGEYVPRLAENKIRMEGIYYNKRYAQSKVGQNPICQSLQ